tara:strand:- start:1069 stop:1275 length:207 start_codon:yes stop_codon:yes gene_type:complete
LALTAAELFGIKFLSQLRFDITYSLKAIDLFLVLKQFNICIGGMSKYGNYPNGKYPLDNKRLTVKKSN